MEKEGIKRGGGGIGVRVDKNEVGQPPERKKERGVAYSWPHSTRLYIVEL